jgi:trigger factor
MKVTQEKLPASQIGLEIEITPEMSKKAYERVLKEFTRSANIPGFRKGKVPQQILIQRIGATRIKAAAVEELLDSSFKDALKQEEIDALGNFQLRSSFEDLVAQFEPGQALVFSASVDVQPDITVNRYKNLQVQAEEIKPDPDRVNKVLQGYQEKIATLVPIEGRPAQMKDIAVVDFKGVLPKDDPEQEPEEIPGGQAQDFQLELLEGGFIEGFIDGIVGMNPGETKEINAQFPPAYPQAEELAGRTAIFTVTLKELKEKELPALDDDFAKEVSEFESLVELRESLETRFSREAENKTRANKEQALITELLNHIEAEIPETLIERELNYMLNQTAMQLQGQGLDIKQLFNQETIPHLKEQSRPNAINQIKYVLALREIAKQEAIEVQPDEVKAKMEEILSDLAGQDVARTIDPERLEPVVSEDLLKEKIMGWLIENSSIELLPEGTLAKSEEQTEAEDTTNETIEVASETISETIEDSPTVTETVPEPAVAAENDPEVVDTNPEDHKATPEDETPPAPKSRKTSKKTKQSTPE